MPARRRYVFARHGDTLADVAERELADADDGERQLTSWNLHLAYRRSPTDEPGLLLPTDIVFLEPPLP